MKNPNVLTVSIELCSAFFSLLFIPLFPITVSTNFNTYLILLIIILIYAITDRLNIEARYGLEPSIFSMLKQLSTVFMIIFGIFFLKEPIILKRVIGSIIIILANIILTFENGKIKINKYFIMSVISNILFAIAMLINVDISNQFNIGIYTIITLIFPSLVISIYSKIKIKDFKDDIKNYDFKQFVIAGFAWSMMLVSSVKAYQIGNVTIVAPLFALTPIFNTIVEFIFYKNSNKLIQKVISALLIILGVILIKI